MAIEGSILCYKPLMAHEARCRGHHCGPDALAPGACLRTGRRDDEHVAESLAVNGVHSYADRSAGAYSPTASADDQAEGGLTA
jgi:hypothetical protein